MASKATKIAALLTSTVEGLGYELWGCEYIPQGHHSILRIYIDNDSGITLDDCQAVSHQISAVLDVEEPITGHYDLEVSSPGLNRPIFTEPQFQRFVGSVIHVRMHSPIQGRRKFKGVLTAVESPYLILLVDDKEVQLDILDIEKANLEDDTV